MEIKKVCADFRSTNILTSYSDRNDKVNINCEYDIVKIPPDSRIMMPTNMKIDGDCIVESSQKISFKKGIITVGKFIDEDKNLFVILYNSSDFIVNITYGEHISNCYE